MNATDRYCSACGAANPATAASCFACGRSLKITVPLPQDISNSPLLQERYRLLAQLGTGGSSAVHQTEDTLLNDRLVAIKAISLRGLKAQEIIDLTGAFNREVLLLSGLKHPGVPHIYQSFSEREGWYVVMDFIEGTTLETYLENMRGEGLPVGEILDLAPPLFLGEMTPMMKRILENTENLLRQGGERSAGGEVSGLPASPGLARGPARVIRTPEEFDRLRPGDVLVAPVTTPAWPLLFAHATAVVTDTGSPLAHALLAAREYGIPAVVGTGNATARLQDGQQVLVDGNTGQVEVQ